MIDYVQRWEAGTTTVGQLADGEVHIWNEDGDAVQVPRADLAALARGVTAAHVNAGHLKLDRQ